MANKNSSFAARIFTIVLLALLIAFVFIPTFSVKAEMEAGTKTETVFETSVSMKDVLAVAFLSDEAKADRLEKLTIERAEAKTKLMLEGKEETEATNEVNSYAISREYALLLYFNDDASALGISASTWMLIAAIIQIVLFVMLAAATLYSYLAMQYDNRHYPVVARAVGLVAGIVGVLLSLVVLFCLRGGKSPLNAYAAFNVFGFIFLALSVYLPVHIFVTCKKHKK